MQSKIDMREGPVEFTVKYRLISGGGAIEERTFAGTPRELVTMYLFQNGKARDSHPFVLRRVKS